MDFSRQSVQLFIMDLFHKHTSALDAGVFPDEADWYKDLFELTERYYKDIKAIDKKYGFDELLCDSEKDIII